MVKVPDRPQQLGLIPVKAVWCSPANLGTADLKNICKCDDGSEYAIKETEIDPTNRSRKIRTAHNEYFCYRLAQNVGIASPSYHFVEMPDGSLAFGSRWEGGSQPFQWWDQVASGAIRRADIAPVLARIYAFDLFVHNVDRHAGNLLIRQQHFGHAAIAFDYSRAWTFHGFPLPHLPMSPVDNTVLVQRQLSALLGAYIDSASTAEVLDRLRQTSVETIRLIIQQQPSSWLTKKLGRDIINWWSSPERNARIDKIGAGISDGTFV